MSAENRRIVLASRASQLAQVQTNIVVDTLKAAFPDRAFDTSFMSTQGDKDLSRALYLLGGKSLWTKELEVALLAGEVDMLVHSLKDVPTTMPEGCALGAILEREHGEDSLVVKQGYTVEGRAVRSLDDLPAGAVIGTSSVRRIAQLKRGYPGLAFKDVVRTFATPTRSHLTPISLTNTSHLKRGNLCVLSHYTNSGGLPLSFVAPTDQRYVHVCI
jgi:hydroxymethylbilane synthase